MTNPMKKLTSRFLPLFAVLTAAMLLSVSCNPDKKEATFSVVPSVAEIKFSADGKTVTAGKNEITPEFTVDTNQSKWEVELSEKDSWLKVNKSGNKFTLSADENTEPTERQPITVTVTAGTAKPVAINVTQAGKKSGDNLDGAVMSITTVIPGGKATIAGFWRDGTYTRMANNADAVGIVSVGSDVYIAGTIDRNFMTYPVYWKNGQMTELPFGDAEGAFVQKIIVSGEDVYILGQENGETYDVLYWKNGELVGRIENEDVDVFDMAISGTDIYITGTQWDWRIDIPVAVYWKNGEKTLLPGGTMSSAIGVEVVGSDVYIGGAIMEDGIMKVGHWKNGKFRSVWEAAEDDDLELASMIISGTDVYMSGYVEKKTGTLSAVYWKNGTMVTLEDDAIAYDILIDGVDIYVTGLIVGEDSEVAVCWKNGVRFELDGDTGDVCATGITLIK